MNHSISLRITHLCGLPHPQNAVVTLQRDALLDHEAFEAFLTPQQFAWLSNAQCVIRRRILGITSAWWLQHGSHQYTCSINDQLISCSESMMLKIGDYIEIGMIRIEVVDSPMPSQRITPLLSPVIAEANLPELQPVPVQTDSTEETLFLPAADVIDIDDLMIIDTVDSTEIPLLTDIVVMSDDDSQIISEEDLTANLSLISDTDASDVLIDDEAIFAALSPHTMNVTQASALMPASCWHDIVPSDREINTAHRSTDQTLLSMTLMENAMLPDDLSLEEALLGPISIDQALDNLQSFDDSDIADIGLFDSQEADAEILQRLTSPAVSAQYPSSVRQIHQSFPDSACHMATKTIPLDALHSLSDNKEST